VHLQRFYAGAWHTTKRAVLSRTSTYSFAIRPSATASYRVYKPADADHARGVSAVRRIVVVR